VVLESTETLKNRPQGRFFIACILTSGKSDERARFRS